MSIFANLTNWYQKELAAGKVWITYLKGVGSAIVHGGWSSLTAAFSASVLDNSKFNLTNGLKSEFDLLVMVFLSSGALAGYIYVKSNKPPTV
jgi:hypothetical protein